MPATHSSSVKEPASYTDLPTEEQAWLIANLNTARDNQALLTEFKSIWGRSLTSGKLWNFIDHVNTDNGYRFKNLLRLAKTYDWYTGAEVSDKASLVLSTRQFSVCRRSFLAVYHDRDKDAPTITELYNATFTDESRNDSQIRRQITTIKQNDLLKQELLSFAETFDWYKDVPPVVGKTAAMRRRKAQKKRFEAHAARALATGGPISNTNDNDLDPAPAITPILSGPATGAPTTNTNDKDLAPAKSASPTNADNETQIVAKSKQQRAPSYPPSRAAVKEIPRHEAAALKRRSASPRKGQDESIRVRDWLVKRNDKEKGKKK
ncbi:hypothetical protein ACLMJK_007772 [Lecanora helva]